ncbi:histidine phosphatase family protein [Xanthobacter versatilis]|uniref:histidine phosphatase family protein n=1 Tax=Xanthobacter autotrophicus (strain ATCC BAA-1158 / Py2) TaxID=78245 RepID=UPI003727B291
MRMLTLVRHGQASFGAADYDRLSPLGERQMRLLGAWWAHTGMPGAHVVRGSLRRHRESATLCLETWGRTAIAVHEEAGFDEFDYAEIVAHHAPELSSHDALVRFLAAEAEPKAAFQRLFRAAVERWACGAHDADYRESWRAFKARVCAALDRADALARDAPVAVFTSGGPIGAVVQQVLDVPDSRVLDLNWALANAGVTCLHQRGGRLTLSCLNATGHLEQADEAGLVTYR